MTELLPDLPDKPDVVHCSDWQTALVPIYIRDEAARSDFFKSIRTVVTVHNIEHQGRYGRPLLEDLFGLPAGWYDDGTLAYDNGINLLKGAILVSDAVTTVSPTYAQELKYAYFAHGLERVVSMCADKLHGVLGGIDTERWNPRRDAAIAASYDESDLTGKAVCKAALQRELGLICRADTPVIAMATPLVSRKGLDLVCEALDAILGQDAQFVLMGKGDKQYEDFFNCAAQRYPGRAAVYIGCSEELSRRIYAGADLFLMPSRNEPCGQSQMIAMRYGAVPIVRETGGLKDSVCAYDPGNGSGSGFRFANYNAGDMLQAVYAAVELYHGDPDAFRALRKRGMAADFGWERGARAYHMIYSSLCK